MSYSFSNYMSQWISRLDERLLLILIAPVVGIFSGVASVLVNLGLEYGSNLLKLDDEFYRTTITVGMRRNNGHFGSKVLMLPSQNCNSGYTDLLEE